MRTNNRRRTHKDCVGSSIIITSYTYNILYYLLLLSFLLLYYPFFLLFLFFLLLHSNSSYYILLHHHHDSPTSSPVLAPAATKFAPISLPKQLGETTSRNFFLEEPRPHFIDFISSITTSLHFV